MEVLIGIKISEHFFLGFFEKWVGNKKRVFESKALKTCKISVLLLEEKLQKSKANFFFKLLVLHHMLLQSYKAGLKSLRID